MIEHARNLYPELEFDVEDLTALTYGDREFDVVMLSGVLEHIPAFEDAISEACRTSASYVILHRCPQTDDIANVYTSGSQYNIKTPRIYFSRQILIKEFKKYGFYLSRDIGVYTQLQPAIISLLKRITKRFILKRQAKAQTRTVVTSIFKRK